MEMKLPKAVKEIIATLESGGYEAYSVGGCVRDTLLGRTPEDWDITTSATPMEIKKLFPKTIDTGIKHGTVTVMKNHVGYEVTTYRIDGEYEDNRHPKQVQFTADLVEDLRRRDFTINAMAYNPRTGLVDAFTGIQDMEKKILRCVGDPGERFDEDALRMLRAVRFSGQLGFEIEEATLQAVKERARHLQNISAERIRVEMTKLLVSRDSGQIRKAYETGMTAYFLPELDTMMKTEQKNPHHIYTVGEHCIVSVEWMNTFFRAGKDRSALASIPAQMQPMVEAIVPTVNKKIRQALCVTMLLHDVAKPCCVTVDAQGICHFVGHPKKGADMAKKIMRRLTYDNETVQLAKILILHHDERIPPTPKAVRKAASRIGRERMPLLCLVQLADVLAQNPEMSEDKLERIRQVYECFVKMEEEQAPLTIRELDVTGGDIMQYLAVKPGPQIGEILEYLLQEVLEQPQQNKKEKLLALAKDKLQNTT